MPLPTALTVATRARRPPNDTGPAAALAIALAWARDRLGRDALDPLDDLTETGYDAIAAYAVDVLKVPAMQAAVADVDNDTVAAIPWDIGRRWEASLCRGNKHLWSIR